jgi:hypothetical protein
MDEDRFCTITKPSRWWGLVENLARPGGNVTGLSIQATDLAGKRVELIREVVPHLHRRHREGPARRYDTFRQAAGLDHQHVARGRESVH